MPDQATLNHAAHVLAAISADQRADTALRFYFEGHRYLQPPARRAISLTVFAYFRWLSWLDPKASPQKRLETAVALHERYTADPKSIKAETLAVRAVPTWIWDEISFAPAAPAPAGQTAEAATTNATSAKAGYLRQLQRNPSLWLRARPGQGAATAKALFACETSPLLPVLGSAFEVLSSGAPTQNPKLQTQNPLADALRFTGTQDLFKTELFKTGAFEIQDLASQLVGHAAAPQPGETWWDACAGEGGKTLHLADLMQNKGVIWATDRNAKRLDTLKRRAARAKLFNYRTALWDGSAKLPTKTKFDGILLDAPCSGVGTWQRNPHARWTTTMDDVRELAATQLALLNHVAGSLKPGGRLLYAVCTLTRSETTAVAAAFTAAHPELEPAAVFQEVSRQKPAVSSPTPTSPASLTSDLSPLTSVFLWPHELDANGMFLAAWRRK